MRKKTPLRNEDGSVLVVALVMVVLLTLLGISSITTSTIDTKISLNERDYKRNFYRAEGAAMTAAQLLHDLSAANRKNPDNYQWFNALRSVDLKDSDNWNSANSVVFPADVNSRYAVIEEGLAEGQPLGLEHRTQLWRYSSFGLCTASRGRVFIETGSRERRSY